METAPTLDARAGLVARIKELFFQPKEEWLKIDSEPATVGSQLGGRSDFDDHVQPTTRRPRKYRAERSTS